MKAINKLLTVVNEMQEILQTGNITNVESYRLMSSIEDSVAAISKKLSSTPYNVVFNGKEWKIVYPT